MRLFVAYWFYKDRGAILMSQLQSMGVRHVVEFIG
jgi:hypothetical protein